jgi:OOP family OmpA-OmpF porin
MNKRILYLVGIVITISIGTYFSWKLCCPHPSFETTESQNQSVSLQKNVKPPTAYAFIITDENGITVTNTKENFRFENSNYQYLSPVSSSLDMEIEKIRNYLIANNNKSILITGLYTNAENNTSAFPNLGIARAISVKNYFNKKGIPSKIMNTLGRLDNELIADSLNVFSGPLFIKITNQIDNSVELEKLGRFLKEHPMILYFKTGQTAINLSSEERQEIADIARYLDKAANATCTITGHTDNTGDSTTNLNIGQKRADFVKQYLVTNGIPSDKIIATSMGQNQPIADNNTEEGRTKNRRITLTIN